MIELGDSVIIKCQSNSIPKWSLNDEELPHNALEFKETFRSFLNTQIILLKNIEIKNKGHYECAGTTETGEDFVSHVLIKILGQLT